MVTSIFSFSYNIFKRPPGVSLSFLLRGSQWPPSYELKKVNNKFWGSFRKIWGSKPSKFKGTMGSWKTLGLSLKVVEILHCVVKSYSFPKQSLVFTCLHYKSFESTVGKGEIARYEQFLLFPQCSLLYRLRHTWKYYRWCPLNEMNFDLSPTKTNILYMSENKQSCKTVSRQLADLNSVSDLLDPLQKHHTKFEVAVMHACWEKCDGKYWLWTEQRKNGWKNRRKGR